MSGPNYYIVRFHDYDLQAELETDDIDRLHNTVFNGLLKIYRNNVHALKFIRVDEKLPGPDLMYRKESIFVVKTEKDYGVDKKIITAIILVETGLGTILGDNRILNTLSSLASLRDRTVREAFWKKFENRDNISRQYFEKRAIRKSGWAYRELKAFLEYTGREKFDPTNIRGSYAGALGISQFMPTTLMAYARDGNQDGTIDLFNHTDAMASIASFLKRFGWRPGISNEKAKKIIYRYNHSDYYVNTIIKISNLLS